MLSIANDHFGKRLFFAFILTLLVQPGNVFARDWRQIELKNISIEAEIVQTEAEQQMGLGNRFSLPEGHGMLFLYDKPGIRVFWMKRMNFAIDIVWFRNRKAVLIEENVPYPPRETDDAYLERYGFDVQADMVLELPAGFVHRNRINLGDPIFVSKKD